MSIVYKNWFVHNIFAHPIMQIVKLFNLPIALAIHDATLPVDNNKQKEYSNDR